MSVGGGGGGGSSSMSMSSMSGGGMSMSGGGMSSGGMSMSSGGGMSGGDGTIKSSSASYSYSSSSHGGMSGGMSASTDDGMSARNVSCFRSVVSFRSFSTQGFIFFISEHVANRHNLPRSHFCFVVALFVEASKLLLNTFLCFCFSICHAIFNVNYRGLDFMFCVVCHKQVCIITLCNDMLVRPC